MPELNVIKLLTNVSHNIFHAPVNPIIGWVIHFVIGFFIWGFLFALFAKWWRMPNYSVKGIVFATLAWLLMMMTLMPAAGVGLFGAKLGAGVAVGTLLMHWIYGAVLGSIYGALESAPSYGTSRPYPYLEAGALHFGSRCAKGCGRSQGNCAER